MELALYCPVYGFYEKEGDIIGRGGDFYTSPAVGPLFGQLLAWQFAEWLSGPRAGRVQIVEAGAHDGTLARDILEWLRQNRPELFQRLEYWIVEPSKVRRARQQGKLKDFAAKILWSDGLKQISAVSGVIFSNELLDAMPVHRLGWDARAKRWFEWGVSLKDQSFDWTRMPAMTEAAVASLPELPRQLRDILPDQFTTEICPDAWRWWKSAAESLSQGRLVTIDYGLEQEEFIAPERREGTLRAYRRHQQMSDVLAGPGEQDITAHVDFSALKRVGEASGLSTEPLRTQGQFLTMVFTEMCRTGLSKEWKPEHLRQFQTLTRPEHLGHRFKVFQQVRR